MKNYSLTETEITKIVELARVESTPFYFYNERKILENCNKCINMPNAFGVFPRYAMKANSSRQIIKVITGSGMGIDASSLNEVLRANMAGIKPDKILLTSQEVYTKDKLEKLKNLLLEGLEYNICSYSQLESIAEFACQNSISLGIRIHPGIGSGESASRNTGDKYSCFGVHLSDIENVISLLNQRNIVIKRVHTHIGSGGDPLTWRKNIDLEISLLLKYFNKATVINFGGGFKVARMPDEESADIEDLGSYAKRALEEVYRETGRKLIMEVEPGTFIMANSGYLVTEVLDIKSTGVEGYKFVVLDGGMESISRQMLYTSRHPFYVVSRNGAILSDEFDTSDNDKEDIVVVGRCCESGDSLTIKADHNITTRKLRLPSRGDFLVVGGAGAYCSSMCLANYNSHERPAEYLLQLDENVRLIRKRETLEQIVENEL